jgi:alpha-2-macroglobulin
MNLRGAACVLACGLFLLTACDLSNAVQVDSFSPEGTVPTLTSFTIVFNTDLAPPERQGTWSGEPFLRFEPPLRGRFKWSDARTLLFSPDMPLQPMTSYEARPTGRVLFGKKRATDFDALRFRTPDLDAMKAEVYWSHITGAAHMLAVRANLHFNYAVSPDALRGALEVRSDGRRVSDVQVLSEEAGPVLTVRLGEVRQTERAQRYTLTVKRGLRSVAGPTPLAEDRSFDATLPPVTELAVTGVASGFDGGKAWIEVGTTQMVDEKRLRDFLHLQPAPRDVQLSVGEEQFRIEVPLGVAETVELTLAKGLPGLYGGELREEYRQDVSFGDLAPSVRFADRTGRYMARSGARALEVHAVNVEELDVEVSQIFANNVLHFLSGNSWYEGGEDYNPSYWVGDFGRPLYKEHVVLSPGRNWLARHTLHMDRLLKQKQHGIYVVRVSSSEDLWLQDSRIISLSDIGLIARVGEDQVVVFARSIADARPLPGVAVTVLSSNNQSLCSGRTGRDGAVVFTGMRERLKEYTAHLVTAEIGDDFTFLDLGATRIETSRFDVGEGGARMSDIAAFMYAERNIYRPGERAHIAAVVRDDRMRVLHDVPVLLTVYAPTGRVFQQQRRLLDGQGSCEIAVDIPAYAQTGGYTADLTTGAGTLAGSMSFSVEEFVPDRLRVQLRADKDRVAPGETVNADVRAEHLFGAPAASLRYNAIVNLRHQPFVSARYPDHDFASSPVSAARIEPDISDGVLDAEGAARITYTVPPALQAPGLLRGTVYVSIFDNTGRPVSRAASFDVHTCAQYIGIQARNSCVGTGQRITFSLVAVDRTDTPVRALHGVATLVRSEWRTVLKKDYSDRYYYSSERREVVEWERPVDLSGGPRPFSFSVTQSGQYELRVAPSAGAPYQRRGFYAYGWGSTTASSFEVDREGRVDIQLDRSEYRPGDMARALFLCPFDGTLLLTVERNGVFEHRTVEVRNHAAQVDLAMREEYLPNVYLTATLFRPHVSGGPSPLFVGHGFASITVLRPEHRIRVHIAAPARARPRSAQTITVTAAAGRDVRVTVAAVDEGILQVRDFRTPDPYGFMYARRALRVSAYDLYRFLLPEPSRPRSSTGGDAALAEQLQRRTNPITTRRQQLLSFWSGIRKADASGRVTVRLDLPQFNGEVRLMAVAFDGARFGSAEKRMKVSDDLILEPQVPRVLTTGDSLLLPVSVVNTTGRQARTVVRVASAGALRLRGAAEQSVDVPAGGSATALFAVAAAAEPGAATLDISARGPVTVSEKVELSVRPASPWSSETQDGELRDGARVSLRVGGQYLRGTRARSLTISRFPAIRFTRQLRMLVGYPHGCLEQSVSKAFPQLYLEDVLKIAAPERYRQQNPMYYVNEGIRKVESMQRGDGAMTLWPGEQESNPWATVYATHFLVEARKAGYAVREDVLQRALGHLARRVRSRGTVQNVEAGRASRAIDLRAPKDIPYALYVLALAGRADVSSMNYYRARPHLLSGDERYLLAGAFALAGQWSAYFGFVPAVFIPETPARETGGNFDSELRANALMASVLLDVDPSNRQIPLILRYLAQRSGQLSSTQETAFTLLALGKAARRASAGSLHATVTAGGHRVAEWNGSDLRLDDHDLGEGAVAISGTGSGSAYYFWSVDGVRASGAVEEIDNNLRVRRAWLDLRTRKPVPPSALRQGQLVLCRITLQGTGRSVDNVVVTDMVPAGCEIENPRLSALAGLAEEGGGGLAVQALDVRDDRLLLFTRIGGSESRSYTYLLRVVNAGRFALPPISADAMYDRSYRSVSGAGTTRVSAR